MNEDIIVYEDMSFDDILILSEEILVPVQEIIQAIKNLKEENYEKCITCN